MESFSIISDLYHNTSDVPHDILETASVEKRHKRRNLDVAAGTTSVGGAIGVRFLLARRDRTVVHVSSSTVSSQVSVVDRRVQRDRSC